MCYCILSPYFSLSLCRFSFGRNIVQYSEKNFSPKTPIFKIFFRKDVLNLTFTELCIIIGVNGAKNTECCINYMDMIIQNSVFVNRNLSTAGYKMETFEKIKELCEENDENMSALASHIGVGASVFTELKKGRTKQLSVSTLNKLAEHFGVPASYFLEDESAEDKQEELFRKRKLLFDMSGKATSEDLDKIIKIVDAFIGD